MQSSSNSDVFRRVSWAVVQELRFPKSWELISYHLASWRLIRKVLQPFLRDGTNIRYRLRFIELRDRQ